MVSTERAKVSPEAARQFIKSASGFVWLQKFELAPGVTTPGANDLAQWFEVAGIPRDLTGMTALDVGTANGGAAFELERRGAKVTAVDAVPAETWGFAQLRSLLDSHVDFVQGNVYDLGGALGEAQFDIVLFWGVLYHLRHPLLGLDELRGVMAGDAWIETHVADGELGEGQSELEVVRFYRRGELAGDPSNWFAPTVRTLLDWCGSCGLNATLVGLWPQDRPNRAMVHATRSPGPPEFSTIEGRIRGHSVSPA